MNKEEYFICALRKIQSDERIKSSYLSLYVYRIRGYNTVNLKLGHSTLEIRSPREIV